MDSDCPLGYEIIARKNYAKYIELSGFLFVLKQKRITKKSNNGYNLFREN